MSCSNVTHSICTSAIEQLDEIFLAFLFILEYKWQRNDHKLIIPVAGLTAILPVMTEPDSTWQLYTLRGCHPSQMLSARTLSLDPQIHALHMRIMPLYCLQIPKL